MDANVPARKTRIRRLGHWLWARRKRTAGLAVLVALVLLNVVAYLHAHAMTHYAAAGNRTASPQFLTRWGKVKVLLTGLTLPRPASDRTPEVVSLPFEVCRFPAEAGGHVEAWYCDRPRPRGLVLLFHGYSGSKSGLLHPARAFHDLGFAVLLVDFRGSGGSSGSEVTVGVREAEDVATAVAYAQSRWPTGPLVLYGQSMGSVAALRAVARHGVRPDALILDSPFDRLLSTVGNRCKTMGLPAFPVAHLLVFWGGVQCGFNGFDHNPVQDAAAVQCPVLHFHAEKDRTVTEEQARQVFDNLGGKGHRFEVLAGVEHETLITARPERWQECVAEFLDGIGVQP